MSSLDEILARIESGQQVSADGLDAQTHEQRAVGVERARDGLQWGDGGADGPVTVQSVVYGNVEARGNTRRRDGTPWKAEEFAARQLLVVLSEAVEAFEHVEFVNGGGDVAILRGHLADVKTMADFVFKFEGLCAGAKVKDMDKLADELADIAIPVDCAFEALGIDATHRKLSKSGRDAGRDAR